MVATFNEVMDILDRWQFSLGRRAGRELWIDKPTIIQGEDLANFNRDLETVRSFINLLKDIDCLIKETGVIKDGTKNREYRLLNFIIDLISAGYRVEFRDYVVGYGDLEIRLIKDDYAINQIISHAVIMNAENNEAREELIVNVLRHMMTMYIEDREKIRKGVDI